MQWHCSHAYYSTKHTARVVNYHTVCKRPCREDKIYQLIWMVWNFLGKSQGRNALGKHVPVTQPRTPCEPGVIYKWEYCWCKNLPGHRQHRIPQLAWHRWVRTKMVSQLKSGWYAMTCFWSVHTSDWNSTPDTTLQDLMKHTLRKRQCMFTCNVLKRRTIHTILYLCNPSCENLTILKKNPKL